MNELERLLKELADKHGELNERQVRKVIREIGRVRSDVAALLAEFVSDDGTIQRRRLMRLLRELDEVEYRMRDNGMKALAEVVDESAKFAIDEYNAILIALIGIPLLRRGKRTARQNAVEYTLNRRESDGLILSDRVWNVSGAIRDAIATQLRSDIIRGRTIDEMVRNIRKIYNNETWMIRRLVITETNTAYRKATAESIERSEVADWLRIIDNRGRHKYHESHRCYELAEEDRYGMGKGVFKPTDKEIFSPHPQCTSFLVPVIKDEYL